MERMTTRDRNGIARMDCDRCEPRFREVCCSTQVCRNSPIDRIAAYEDTGLEPREVSAAMENGTYAQFQEWNRAHYEGCLIVLPCKVGDTVYTESNIKGLISSFPAPDETWIFENRAEFGKTVFLTREEAEAKLKEVEDDG